MAEFPTVGLGIDLSGLDAGVRGYGRVEEAINKVGEAADRLGKKVTINMRAEVSAQNEIGAATRQRAARAETAAQAETRAARAATNEAKRLYNERVAAIRVAEQAQRAAATAAIGYSKAEAEAAKTALANLRLMAPTLRANEAAARAATAAAIRDTRLAIATDERAAKTKLAGIRQTLEANKAASAATIAALKAEEQETKNAIANLRLKAAAAQAAGRAVSGGGGGGGGSIVTPAQLSLVNRFGSALGLVRGGLREFRRALFDVRTALGVFLGGMIVQPIVKMADAMTALQARAGAFTESASDVPFLMERIYLAAQNTRSPLEAIATLYTRLAPLARQVGKSQLDLLKITETVAKGIQIGGATPEEAKSSSQQLAQALASNRLGGDELRSLAENAPLLLGQIAKALGKNTGEFIKWAQAGHANTQVVLDALETAAPVIDAIFAKFPVTIGQSVTMVSNSIQHMVGSVNSMTKASSAIAGFIGQFAGFLDKPETINAVANGVIALGKALEFMGQAIQGLLSYLPAFTALLALMGAAKLIQMALGWQALQKALLAYSAAAAIAGRGTATLMVAQTAASGAAAAFMRVMGPLVTMLGGPLGIALIAGALAWNTYSNAQKIAEESGKTLTNAQEGALSAIQQATAYAETYGISTNNLADAMSTLSGATNNVTTATDGKVTADDRARKMALDRANAERVLTRELLLQRSAEAYKQADKIEGALDLQSGFMGALGNLGAGPGAQGVAARAANDAATTAAQADARKRVGEIREAGRLTWVAAQTYNNPLTAAQITIPNIRGPAQAAADAAKKGPKGPADPRDLNDERIAQINAAVAQAAQDELDARISITRDVAARAVLEKQVNLAELAEKDARVAKMTADVLQAAQAKQIAPETEKYLLTQLAAVEIANERVAIAKNQLVDEQSTAEITRNANDVANAQAQAGIDLLQSQSDSAEYAFQRRDLDKQILTANQALEKQALLQVVHDTNATKYAKDIAQARLDVLDAIHANEQRKQDGGIQQAFDNVANALNDVASNFKSKNWAGLVNSLVESIGSIRQAFGANGTLGGKVGAISGIANVAGSAIGGSAGAGLMGAAGGAAAGVALTSAAAAGGLSSLGIGTAALAGPAGIAVIAGLAVVGGIMSLFGDAKAKKRQKEEERAKAAADAATLALETANQAREIEVEILTLQGDALGARNVALEAERAGIASSNLARFDELQALRDAASIRELNIQLLEAQGTEESLHTAALMRQEDALKKLTPEQQELTRQIWAATDAVHARATAEAQFAIIQAQRDQAVVDATKGVEDAERDLTQARERERQATIASVKATAEAAQKTRDTYKTFLDSLTDFRRKLNTGDVSGLSTAGNYRALKEQFTSTAGLAALGNEDALNRLQGVSEEFLAASKDNATDSLFYLRDLAMVKQAVEAARDTSQRTVDIAQLQLDAANAQLSALETINESFMSVADAINNLAAAQAALAQARAVAASGASSQTIPWSVTPNGNGSYAATPDPNDYGPMTPSGRTATNYLVENPDVWAAAAAAAAQGLMTEAEFARQHYEDFGKAEGRQGFAAGGFHPGGLRLVGEKGPELEATGASRIWNSSQTAEMLGGGTEAMVAEQRETNRRLDALDQKLALISKDTGSLENNVTMVTQKGKGIVISEDSIGDLATAVNG